MALNQIQVGVQNNTDGSPAITARGGKQGDTIVSELHGRFYEQTYRGNVFRGGMTALTSISNATFTTATTGATATPIIGLYNPLTSSVNCVILQAMLEATITAGTATGPGTFVWMVGTNQAAITTGATPFNAKTLSTTSGGINGSGSLAKNVSGVALTGLSGTIAVAWGSSLFAGLIKNISSVETAVGQNIGMTGVSVENFDGSLIVPPGGVIALMATTTPVAHSATSGIVWEEVPI